MSRQKTIPGAAEPLAITTLDVGAAAGSRTWTEDLPLGLSLLVGPNGAGKTTLVRTALAASAARRDFELPRHYDLDGKSVVEARLRWGTAEVVTRELAGGEVETLRAGTLPPMRSIGADLVALVQPGLAEDGKPDADGSTPRQRLRARALARLLRIPVDPPALDGLFRCVAEPHAYRAGDLAVQMPGDDVLMWAPARGDFDLWNRLLPRARAKGGAKEKALVELEDGATLRRRLLDGTYATLVDAADELRKRILLPLRRTAERLAAVLAEDIAAAGGACTEISGEQIPGKRHAALLGAPRREVAEAEARTARANARELSTSRGAGLELQETRERRLAELGEEPEPADEALLTEAEGRVLDARAANDAAAERVSEAHGIHSGRAATLAETNKATESACLSWSRLVRAIDQLGPLVHRDQVLPTFEAWAEAAEERAAAQTAESEAHDALARAHRAAAAAADSERTATEDRDRVLARQREQRQKIDEHRARRAEWTAPARAFATELDVAEAVNAAGEASARVTLAAAGERYRELWQRLEALRAGAAWLASIESAADQAATAAWTALGEVLTSRIARPWIRMSGLEIQVCTRARGGNEAQEIDHSGAGFWRTIDGGDLSTGGGAAPFLDLAVETTEPGEIVWVEWTATSQPVASLGTDAKRRLSARIAERGARWIAEQPGGGVPRIEWVPFPESTETAARAAEE